MWTSRVLGISAGCRSASSVSTPLWLLRKSSDQVKNSKSSLSTAKLPNGQIITRSFSSLFANQTRISSSSNTCFSEPTNNLYASDAYSSILLNPASRSMSRSRGEVAGISGFFSLPGLRSPLHAGSPSQVTFHIAEGSRASSSSTQTGDSKTAESKDSVENTDTYKQLSAKDKLKRLVAEYGATVMVVHLSNCLLMLGAFWLAVSSGLDIPGIFKSLGIESEYLNGKLASGAGSFAVAYVAYKVFIPLRFAITFALTPVLVRFLRTKGIIKPPKAKVNPITDVSSKVKST